MNQAPHWRNRAWLRYAIVLGIGLSGARCSDDPGAPKLQPNPPTIDYSATLDPAMDVGIGGRYTMSASGGEVVGIPLGPTGISLPPGIPVRVVASGQVTRVTQPGFTFFCSYFVALCTNLAPMLGDAPIEPWGVPIVDGAVVMVSWDGGAPTLAQKPNHTLLKGMSGGQLYVGRSKFTCNYGWVFGSGPCYMFGGSHTVVVHADDGGDGNPAEADLRLAITSQNVGASGGPVSLKASTSDGSVAADIKWYFIPDAAPVMAKPVTAAMRFDVSTSTDAEAGQLEIGGLHDVSADGATKSMPVRTEASMAKPAARFNNAASYTSLSNCDGSLTCNTTINVSEGTFVVSAVVHGVPRAAEQRVAGGAGGGGQAELLLSCTPATLIRGEVVTCKAAVQPESAKLEDFRWSFSGDGGLTAEGTTTDPEWKGPAAVSGTVKLVAAVDGKDQEKEATFTVRPRDWSNEKVDHELKEVAADLPERPDVLADLGRIDFSIAQLFNTQVFSITHSGPNNGIAFTLKIPFKVDMEVHINRVAMAVNSDFWKIQYPTRRVISGVQWCGRDDVVKFLPIVEDHEGLTFSVRSHAYLFREKMNELAGPAVEGIVGSDPDVIRAALSQVQNDVFLDKARKAADLADQPPLVPVYCRFRYDYPSGK